MGNENDKCVYKYEIIDIFHDVNKGAFYQNCFSLMMCKHFIKNINILYQIINRNTNCLSQHTTQLNKHKI